MQTGMIFLRLAFVVATLSVTAVSADEIQIRHGSTTLNANLEIAEGRTLRDGVIVIVHALMQHHDTEIIRGLQTRFAEAGRNSLAITLSLGIDNRRGSYECTTPHRYLFQDAVDEGLAWLAWLKTQGVGSVIMLGHSLGANQVLKLTVEHYDPIISAMVLLSPMTMGVERLRAIYKTRYREHLDKILAQATTRVAQGSAQALMRADFHICPQTDVAANTFLDYYGGEPLHADPSSHLGRAIPPVLIVVGSADERQPNVGTFLERFSDNQHIVLYTVESAGHFFRDLNLDEAAEETLAFLEERIRASVRQ